MKKRILYSAFFVFVIAILLFLPIVSAQFIDQIKVVESGVKKGFGMLVGSGERSLEGDILLVKLLVLILVVTISKFSLERSPFGSERRNKGVVLLISIVVGLMAVRYLTSETIINFIWLPYGALGVIISTFIPFLIYFFFVESIDESIARKVGWIIFGVIYAALGILRWEELKVSGSNLLPVLNSYVGQWWMNLAMVYVLIALLSLLAVIFDKRIRYKMFLRMVKNGENVGNALLAFDLEKELKKVKDALDHIEVHGGDSRRKNTLKDEKRRLESALINAKSRR